MHLLAVYTSVLIMAGAVPVEIAAQASIARISRCSKEDHHKCIALADPLLKDPHLIFPDNMKDIDMVCRTWSSFVDCIKRYIDGCFSKQRQEQFNSAVEVPIASVHQMCSVSTYQAEYLQYASCLKATVIEAGHCGNQYAALVDEVSKGEMARTSLCCSHYHFRSCVILETKKKCDGSESGGAAARFSRQVLDKALSFLQDQCQNYIPNNADCPSAVTDTSSPLAVSPLDDGSLGNPESNKGRSYSRTASTDNYAGQASTFYGSSTNTAHPSSYRSTGRALNYFPTEKTDNDNMDNTAAPTRLSTDIGSQKSSTPQEPTHASKILNETEGQIQAEQTNNTPAEPHEEPAIVVTQRPSNYGRGMSWASPTAKSSTEIPAWATSTWLTSNQMPVTDEAWYPAAGSFGGNNIDEPNQQGLSKNGQSPLRSELLYLAVLSVVFYLL